MKSNVVKIADGGEINVEELAVLALESTDGTVSQASIWLAEYILKDRALLDALTPRAFNVFAREHVRKALGHRREERSSKMNVVPIDGSVFNEAVLSNYDRYMSRPIWGGKPISDCTAAEIYESADKYDSQACTMTREAKWQAAVAKALEKNGPSEAKVRECLSEATLSKLWEEASGDKN